MTLGCRASEVAIYVPPRATSSLPPDQALDFCGWFLDAVADEPATDRRVYDDRAARLDSDAPALDALLADASKGVIRVLLLADPPALARISSHSNALALLDEQVEVVEAALALVSVPTPEELGDLQLGVAATWQTFLEPLSRRRPRGRGTNALPLVGAPRALVEAFLSCDTLSNWCRAAAHAAPEALASMGATMQAQAIRHFETWLRDGTEDVTRADPEAPYWQAIAACHACIARGDWNALAEELDAARSRREALGFAGSPTLEGRLSAAVHLGRRSFSEAWKTLEAAMLLEALFGGAWEPSAPVTVEVGVSEEDNALRYVAFLITRVPSTKSAELIDALEQLVAVLPSDQAEALRDATSGRKNAGTTSRAATKATRTKTKPARRRS